MNTHYLTLILRLRLEAHSSQECGHGKVSGSLQQAGVHPVHYFDSLEKLQRVLQQLVEQEVLNFIERK